MDDKLYARRRKLLAGISIAVVIALTAFATWFFGRWLTSFTQEGLRDYIRSFGAASQGVFLGLQVLQVFIALIPGEILESVAGFLYGPVFGTLLCYMGLAVASAMVFFLTRRFGIKLVEVFVSREKINSLRFLNTEKKRNCLIFLIFFVPGTPKDLVTYFAGLTDIKFGTFLALSLVARFPSIISSTLGGHFLGAKNFTPAIIVYSLTAILGILGMILYNKWSKKRETSPELHKSSDLGNLK